MFRRTSPALGFVGDMLTKHPSPKFAVASTLCLSAFVARYTFLPPAPPPETHEQRQKDRKKLKKQLDAPGMLGFGENQDNGDIWAPDNALGLNELGTGQGTGSDQHHGAVPYTKNGGLH